MILVERIGPVVNPCSSTGFSHYIEDRIDLNRELLLSLMSPEQLVVVGYAMRGVVFTDGALLLFDRVNLPSSGRCVVALHDGEVILGIHHLVNCGLSWALSQQEHGSALVGAALRCRSR